MFLLLPTTGLHAEVKEASVEFRVTRFDPQDRPAPKYKTPDGTEIEVPLHTIDGPYKVKLRDESFLDLQPAAGGKPTTIEIPPGLRRDLLLLFVPDKDGYRVLLTHAPVTRIGGGDCFVTNATPSELAIQYGSGKPSRVAPARSAVLHSPAGNKYEMLPVVIAQMRDEKWKTVRSENWPSDPRFRTFLVIYELPPTGKIEIHAVPDRLQKPE
ncbi:MAG: hypothetical protein ACO3G9_07925 [Chthoniobacterales bacterium]